MPIKVFRIPIPDGMFWIRAWTLQGNAGDIDSVFQRADILLNTNFEPTHVEVICILNVVYELMLVPF